MNYQKIIPDLFKSEYSNLVAVLCNYYGLQNIQAAEDIVSETFIQAMKTWSIKDTPNNQVAWLRKVAVNKALDYHKRNKIKSKRVLPEYENRNDNNTEIPLFEDDVINDSLLKMLFVLCHPQISTKSQLILSLKILCGFSTEQIASAFLSNKEAINKTLFRAKKKIRDAEIKLNLPSEHELESRLDTVLKSLYLLFNEGYYSITSVEKINEDLCWEAIRLTILLTNHPKFNKPKTNALLALMCFQTSRLKARKNGNQHDVLYYEQDTNLWDKQLIEKGSYFLQISAQGKTLSKYHLEASIAFWHTQISESKWEHILQLYNHLLRIEYSPITALNRTYALAKANSVDDAIKQALNINLKGNHLYYSLLAELYAMSGNMTEYEIEYLNMALRHATKNSDKQLIQKKLQKALSKLS